MSQVKSPYNFVPAPKENDVFTPDWADQVSHDLPFSDGESGEISIKITAETPIFIRNGHHRDEKMNEFSHYTDKEGNKQYFIPGSSIKGMVRNVLEIMSRSRMKQVQNTKHSVRQIMKTKGTVIDEKYGLTGEEKKKINAGYLVKQNGKYYVYDCGKPTKIRYTDLDQKLNTDFGEQFGGQIKSNMNTDFSARTGEYKYINILKDCDLENEFEKHPLNDNDKQSSWVSKFQHLPYSRFATEDDEIEKYMGRIVCTGQATDYNQKTARKGEYVFKGKRSEVIHDEKVRCRVDSKVLETFHFINQHNKGKNSELKDWTYWKTKIKDGIPVFFRKNNDGSIKDMGLTFMYKEPVQNSVNAFQNYTEDNSEEYKLDLAETMFGYTSKKNALKGRIMVGHASCMENCTVIKEQKIVLSSPRSSYTPFYLKQSGDKGKTEGFNTYNTNSELRGFKRYPIRTKIGNHSIEGLSKEMVSEFSPLDKGSAFSGKIRFHNLRKVEIGALLSALTFHGNSDKLFHSLGGAKPFGYGRIKLEVKSDLANEQIEYLKTFEFEMRKHDEQWNNSDYIKELLTMASIQEKAEATLSYMDLKKFQELKDKGLFLQDYTELSSDSVSIDSTDNEEYESYKKAKQEKEKAKKQEAEKKEAERKEKQLQDKLKRKQEAEQQAYNLALEKNTVQALDRFINSHIGDSNLVKDAKVKKEAIIKKNRAFKIATAQKDKYHTTSTKWEDVSKWMSEKAKIKEYLFTDQQKSDFIIAATKCYETEFISKKGKFFKKKKIVGIKKYPWTNITKWLGEEQAKVLYKGLTENDV